MNISRSIFSYHTINHNQDLHSYDDQPSVVNYLGDKYWHYNGVLHRLTGPAVILANGTQEWHFYGHKCSSEEHFNQISKLKAFI